MRRPVVVGLAAAVLVGGGFSDATAQEDQQFLAVGEMAPDFEFTGATRYGVLTEPVHLSGFRGEVAVLAFFFKARTGG
jgi:hypothetical protein